MIVGTVLTSMQFCSPLIFTFVLAIYSSEWIIHLVINSLYLQPKRHDLMFCRIVVFILEGIFFTQTNVLIHFAWFIWLKWFGISDLTLYCII